MDTNWYVIQVIRGKEEQTASLCRNRIPSTILEECFIPKYKMKKKYQLILEKHYRGNIYVLFGQTR